MKVIFLDFDGVILTLRTCVAQGCGWSRATPDPVLVTALRRCCEAGVRVVVSSTWRTHEKSCREKLKECDLFEYLHSDWRTCERWVDEVAGSRREEVREWTDRHPEITDYRILDDDEWNWTPEQKERFLKCDPEDGASAQTILALLEWAGAKRRTIEAASSDEVSRYAVQFTGGNDK